MSNHINNQYFDLEKARKYLEFAIQFTPQYGDSFLELLRLFMIQDNKQELQDLKQFCIHAEPNYGVLWFYYKDSVLDNAM